MFTNNSFLNIMVIKMYLKGLIEMKELLALLMYHSHNVHILHWKTTGLNFQKVHEMMDELYAEMLTHVDLIAEMMLQMDQDPLSFQEMISIIEDLDSENINPNISYDEANTFKKVISIFDEIIKHIDRIYESEIPRAMVGQIEEMQSWYMLRSKYLLPRTLVGATGSFESIYKLIK